MSKREMAVGGSFYTRDCAELLESIARFHAALDMQALDAFTLEPRAVIVPHAGHIYSGFTANAAYEIAARRQYTARVVVIGPSHRVAFDGASIALQETFATPCGDIDIDVAYAKALQQRHAWLQYAPQMHHEHSTEVQMPFIKHYFDGAAVVEIVYGRIDPEQLASLIASILESPETLLVISTDLSHFYTQEQAKCRDAICVEGVAAMNVNRFDEGCEACGMAGVKALIVAASALGFRSEIVDYRSSAEVSGDTSRVVGYLSALVGR